MPYEDYPSVGQECYYSCGSDRYPCTVTSINASRKTVVTRDALFTRTDSNGLSESQTYSFQANPNGQEQVWTWRAKGGADGAYVRKGEPLRGGTRLRFGYGYQAYQDPSL